MPTDIAHAPAPVLPHADIESDDLLEMLHRFDLELVQCDIGQPIPGSYWGDVEAGLRGNRLYARADTPLHSILHEASHYICISPGRRKVLDTNAGSDDAEENAVCYLQVLLADHLPCLGRDRLFADMDAWGYSFRLGSTRAWFTHDAEDARHWLLHYNLITDSNVPTWQLRS